MNKLTLMSPERVLFITNAIFLNKDLPEGGVRFCTDEYIELLKARYEVAFLPVAFNRSLKYRIKYKFGIDAYEEYRPADYFAQLKTFFGERSVTKVFINLANASEFSRYIKTTFSEYGVKVVLCSHGNESGDFLHQTVRFSGQMPLLKRLSSAYRLGKVLQKESFYRLHFMDCVLTVSPIEESIEKWLGARSAYMVPRVFQPAFLEWKPKKGRVGFVGDMSHPPNYYGILKLSEAIDQQGNSGKIEIRVVGKTDRNTAGMFEKYPFVKLLGYLDNTGMMKEAASWNYYLNPVFYYSKGVSTKLGKGINWGLPVLSTTAGNRGYIFRGGTIATIDDPAKMAAFIGVRMEDPAAVARDRAEVLAVANGSLTFREIIDAIHGLLEG